jgi:hypothetical protein
MDNKERKLKRQLANRKYYATKVKPNRVKKPIRMWDRVRCVLCGMLSNPERHTNPDTHFPDYYLAVYNHRLKHYPAEQLTDKEIVNDKQQYILKQVANKMIFLLKTMYTKEQLIEKFSLQDVVQLSKPTRISQAPTLTKPSWYYEPSSFQPSSQIQVNSNQVFGSMPKRLYSPEVLK